MDLGQLEDEIRELTPDLWVFTPQYGYVVVWHGGATFNVHQVIEDGHVVRTPSACFTVYGNAKKGTPPSRKKAMRELQWAVDNPKQIPWNDEAMCRRFAGGRA